MKREVTAGGNPLAGQSVFNTADAALNNGVTLPLSLESTPALELLPDATSSGAVKITMLIPPGAKLLSLPAVRRIQVSYSVWSNGVMVLPPDNSSRAFVMNTESGPSRTAAFLKWQHVDSIRSGIPRLIATLQDGGRSDLSVNLDTWVGVNWKALAFVSSDANWLTGHRCNFVVAGGSRSDGSSTTQTQWILRLHLEMFSPQIKGWEENHETREAIRMIERER